MVSPRTAKMLRRARAEHRLGTQHDSHVIDFYQNNSAEVMAMMDELPPAWRKLARKYGLVITRAMLESLGADNISSAEIALEQRREGQQQEWLNTNFFLNRKR